MIPLTALYDEYIDRSKLSEQKNPFEYIAPPSDLKCLFRAIFDKKSWISIYLAKILVKKIKLE